MTTAELKAKIEATHDPDGWKASGVLSVWSDGEVTYEKGGELFGQRTLHMFSEAVVPRQQYGCFPKELADQGFETGKPVRIFVRGGDMDQAERIRLGILDVWVEYVRMSSRLNR